MHTGIGKHNGIIFSVAEFLYPSGHVTADIRQLNIGTLQRDLYMSSGTGGTHHCTMHELQRQRGIRSFFSDEQ